MDTMQKNPSPALHHPAVKLVISLVVVILVISLGVWVYKRYAPSKITNGELTPAQKEQIINNLNQQQSTAPQLSDEQKSKIVKDLVQAQSQESQAQKITEEQKKAIIENLNRMQAEQR